MMFSAGWLLEYKFTAGVKNPRKLSTWSIGVRILSGVVTGFEPRPEGGIVVLARTLHE
jgi:hypothetical protein